MAEDKELKFLIYIVSGIAVVSFLYLIYKDWSNEHKNMQYMSHLSSINTTPSNQVSNEAIYSSLENQQNNVQNQQYQLEDISIKLQSTVERLDKLDTKLQSSKEQLEYVTNTKLAQSNENINISKLEQPANHPSNQKFNIGDRIRKLKFNMI